MLKRDVVILIVAAVSGLFSFMLVANYLKSSSGKQLQFVEAVRPIMKGESIVKESVSLSKPMKQKTPETLYMHTEDVVGNVASEDIPKDNLITRAQVSPPAPAEPAAKKKEFLPIPAGMSAITLAARQVDSMPESIGTGSYMDILGTVTNLEGARNILTIVRGAQVLSVERAEDGEIKSISAAVTSHGAVAVSKALANGKLNLVLRSYGADKGSYNGPEIESIEIIRGIEKSKSVRVK